MNVPAHCLLASKDSDEESVDNLTEYPLYVTSPLSCAFQIFLSLSFDCNLSWFGLLWIYSWGSLSFLDAYIHVIHQIAEVNSSSYLSPFSHLLELLQYVYCSAWRCSRGALYSVHFHLFFFNFPILKFTDSSVLSHLLLNPSSKFFIAIMVILAPEFFFYLFLCFLYLEIFPFCSYSTLLPFSLSSLVIWSSVR